MQCKIINIWGRSGFDGDVESIVASRCRQTTLKVATKQTQTIITHLQLR